MVYRFVSLDRKISSKGNAYGCVVFINLNGQVFENFIYDVLLSRLESLALSFGDYVDIDCDLKGIVNINLLESGADINHE